MTQLNTGSLMWLGAGDIAARSRPALDKIGLHTTFVSRSRKPSSVFDELLTADLSVPEQAFQLAKRKPEFCVLSLSPRARTLENYHRSYLDSLSNILQGFARVEHCPKLLIFVSSTSVYAQAEGEVVDEASETTAASVSASTMLACESLLKEQKFATCALRFSGIYGPGRFNLLKRVTEGKFAGEHWTNRIHIADCAGVIVFLLQQALANVSLPKCILASDDRPIKSTELSAWLAERLGLSVDAKQGQIGSERVRGLGKRCDNTMLKSLGYEFQHSDFESGFPRIISEFQKRCSE